MLPYLFNHYSKYIMWKAGLESMEEGIQMGGCNLNKLRYAGDITLLAETEEGLKYLLHKVQEVSAQHGLHMNLKKTKVLSTSNLQEF